MKLILMSDTHGKHDEFIVPEGDIFIHCGDLSKRGKITEIEKFAQFLENLPHQFKIVICGNHDFCFENQLREKAEGLIKNAGAYYLNDSGIEIRGLKFWGSPIQPWFYDCAFNRTRGADIKAHWDLIPEDTDILITHGPPYGILDKIKTGEHVGCEELEKRVMQIKPKIHVFGHIHESYGILDFQDIKFINAANLSWNSILKNEIICLEINEHLHSV